MAAKQLKYDSEARQAVLAGVQKPRPSPAGDGIHLRSLGTHLSSRTSPMPRTPPIRIAHWAVGCSV